MSKKSHVKHEHKSHPHHAKEPDGEVAAPAFNATHKKLIWAIIIIFAVFAPLLFAVLSILRVI